MKKKSVRSAGKLHIPYPSDEYPYKPLEPPTPLCSMFANWEDPTWSALPANCEACKIKEKRLIQKRNQQKTP